MESVEIIATDKYLPKRCITNKSIEKNLIFQVIGFQREQA